ncbi:MAG: hypothetical protein F6K26_30785 [Moorea sp. SIO2I5]|nr:hypothetical protein [Moorena sp. SIO2I5]
MFPFPYSRLDAVAHGGNHGKARVGGTPKTALPPQDRAASLFPVPCSLFPVPCSLWYSIPITSKTLQRSFLLFPVPCSLFPSLLPTPDSLLPTPYSLPKHDPTT